MAAPGKVFERRCKSCVHPERARVEQDLARGVSLAVTAKKYSLPMSALHRHWQRHVPDETKAQIIGGPARLAELAEIADRESLSTLEYFAVIRGRLFDRFLACDAAGDTTGMSNVSGRIIEVLKEIGRATGELRQLTSSVTVNNNTLIMQSPVVAEIEAMLVSVLAHHPEARAAVIAGLRRIDEKHAPASTTAPMIDATPLMEAFEDA